MDLPISQSVTANGGGGHGDGTGKDTDSEDMGLPAHGQIRKTTCVDVEMGV